MSNKAINIVFAFDDRVLRPAAVAIRSLIDAALEDTTYLIHIVHPGFHSKITTAFTEITLGTRHTVSFHKVDSKRFDGLPSGRGSWTEIVYYRFLIPEILAKCERAIYSDVDVYFKGDLSALIDLDMQEAAVAAVVGELNRPGMKCHHYFPENKSNCVFMSGFLLMDLEKMRKEKLADKLLNTAKQYGARLKMFDLDALNLTCKHILPLPFEYCVLETVYQAESIEQAPEFEWLSSYYSLSELESAKASTKIIHYAGPLGKPWRRTNQPSYYKEALKGVPEALNKTTTRDMRKYWGSAVSSLFKNITRQRLKNDANRKKL